VIALYRRLQARGPSFARNVRLVRFLLAQGAVEEASRALLSTPTNGNGVEGALLRGEIERRRENPSAALESLHIAFDAWPEDKRPHLCSDCGRGVSEWSARCPGCGGWNVLHPADDPPATSSDAPSIRALLRRLVTR
jgi:lipopolysaccharide biosynthesis regulator YciM